MNMDMEFLTYAVVTQLCYRSMMGLRFKLVITFGNFVWRQNIDYAMMDSQLHSLSRLTCDQRSLIIRAYDLTLHR